MFDRYRRKKMKIRYIRIMSIIMSLLLIMLSGGCKSRQGGNAVKQEITVFAASSLTESLQEIVKLFEKENPEVKVKLNLDSTSRLRLQIEQGVEGDVFFSANKQHYDALKKEGYITKGQALLYNSMVVILPKNNPAHIEKVEDLQNKCKLVLALKEVPAGDYARKIIHSLSGSLGAEFEKKVLNNIVSEENNVKQVVNKVVMGEADAAFVYSSDITQSVKDKVEVVEIAPKYNVRAEYFIGKLKAKNENQYIKKIYSFLIGEEAQKIFKKYGFNSIK
ncbi:molybdate ABC transporter substrate-binding protein [Clostridium tagluense]|uniref:molybdate ABC transporter substrate-binding protein n=1 Tax=Clostridium tagluense TaxID=360422 RepID=UPI001CF469BB|nr:molybdate ABC transporter substrate-binding protein [Clostridium tagluense]MCB2297510.1 molybdate ABC transporter substrate-binding protein [Clostridium tagluense]